MEDNGGQFQSRRGQALFDGVSSFDGLERMEGGGREDSKTRS